MRRVGSMALLVALAAAGPAAAQEGQAGAGRIEVAAFPGGGTFFTKGSDHTAPSFKDYALGASATINLNRYLGVEGEIGGGIGVKQSLRVNGTVFRHMESPSTLAYNANMVYDPTGSDRAVVPYATGGIGGLTLFARRELEPLGLADDETFFTGNVGGGLKWFASRHWGLRGDYRLIMVKGKETSSTFFGPDETRYGHRLYGSVLFTFGE